MKTRTPRDPHAVRDEWLTIEEVCTELKISRRSFDRWRALGTGPKAQHLGGNGPVRVRRSWLDEWLDAPTRTSRDRFDVRSSHRGPQGPQDDPGSAGSWPETSSANRSPPRQLAEAYRAKLITAARNGEAFSTETGLPRVHGTQAPRRVVLPARLEFTAATWPTAAARSRSSIIENLARSSPSSTRDLPGAPIRTCCGAR